MNLCGRCNRMLKTPKNVEVGYGPVCHKKHLQEQRDAEFERNQLTIDEVINDERTYRQSA